MVSVPPTSFSHFQTNSCSSLARRCRGPTETSGRHENPRFKNWENGGSDASA